MFLVALILSVDLGAEICLYCIIFCVFILGTCAEICLKMYGQCEDVVELK